MELESFKSVGPFGLLRHCCIGSPLFHFVCFSWYAETPTGLTPSSLKIKMIVMNFSLTIMVTDIGHKELFRFNLCAKLQILVCNERFRWSWTGAPCLQPVFRFPASEGSRNPENLSHLHRLILPGQCCRYGPPGSSFVAYLRVSKAEFPRIGMKEACLAPIAVTPRLSTVVGPIYLVWHPL